MQLAPVIPHVCSPTEFLEATGLKMTIGDHHFDLNCEDKFVTFYPITFKRIDGKSATFRASTEQRGVAMSPYEAFSYFKVILASPADWAKFSEDTRRGVSGVNLKTCRREFFAYNRERKPLLTFFTPDEQTAILNAWNWDKE